jgi:hypothetical protein
MASKGMENMKTSPVVKSLLFALALLAVPNLLAENKGSLHVSVPEIVAGQPLDPGDYVVRWDDSNPNVQIRIMRGKVEVATATAHEMTLERASSNDSVVVENSGERRNLSLIFFSGKKVALEIQGPSGTTNISKK